MFSRLKHFNVFIKDPDKKAWLKLVKECIHFAYLKKEMPTDYFRKYLYRKDIVDYKHYLSLNQFNAIMTSSKMIFPEVSARLNDKLIFHDICKKQNLSTPEVISYNSNNRFVFNDLEAQINNSQELILFFEKVFDNSKITKLFIKPIEGMGGDGCFILKKERLKEQIIDFGESLLNSKYIHQEMITQHPSINKIHSKSVNTIRMDTYIDKNNKFHILSALMRFGAGDCITDNTHTGGFYISINSDSGKLQGVGRQDVVEGGSVCRNHPDSDYKLEGFQVPYFNEACELVLSAMKHFPNRIIGWDVAITDSGPTIVEGNHYPSLHVTDVAYGGYCKHPLIQDILKEIKD